MRQPLERIETDQTLPDSADVVVVGGGMAGISTAYFLAKHGVSAVVLEKGVVAAEQSSRNWGWCRQQGRDPLELDLARLSMQLWETLPGEVGADLGFRRTGVLFVTHKPGELAKWEQWRAIARRHGIESEILSADEAQAAVPSAHRWVGGLRTPSDGRAEPSLAVPRLAAAARRLGVVILQHCAARVIETEGGRIRAVATERGRIRTSTVLCAGGAWSSMFCRRHGIDLPQAVVQGSVATTTAGPESVGECLSTPGFSMRPRVGGGYMVAMSGRGTVQVTPSLMRYGRKFLPTYMQRRKGLKIRVGKSFVEDLFRSGRWSADQISPFESGRTLDPDPDMELLGRAIAELHRTFPDLRTLDIAHSWGGVIDSTPDGVPVISPVEALNGFYISTGFSGHGFGVGPAAGLLAAELITGATPSVDPAPFRYARMIDGTRLRPNGQF